MALGIGANTAVFSVVNAVLLKPLAYRDPDRIVTLSSLWRKSGGHGQVSAPDFHDWHNQSTAFAAMAYYDDDSTSVMSGASAEYAHVAEVTPEFFQVFAVEPVAGRLFSPEEQKPGGAGAVVISYTYWQSHFGANANALGQAVRMLGKSSISPECCRRASTSRKRRISGCRRTWCSRRRSRARLTITWWSGG